MHPVHIVQGVSNAHCAIRLMVQRFSCINDGVATDPACGTSGFLVAAGEYLKENKKDEIFFDKQKKDHYMNHMFHGYDMDRTMVERIMCGSQKRIMEEPTMCGSMI